MQTILVPLDGSPFGEHALPVALALARRGALGLDLVHVHHRALPHITPAGSARFDPAEELAGREREAAYLAELADRVGERLGGRVTRTLLEPPIVEALCHHAVATGAQLIALSTHGRDGVARAWLGSVADRLVRTAPVPVLVVRPGADPPALGCEPDLSHVLVPLDGSPFAERALGLAVRMGRLNEARYTLVRVVEPVVHHYLLEGARTAGDVDAEAAAWHEATDYLKGVAERLRSQGLRVTTDVRIGQPAAEILDLARVYGVGLIAMTTHGRGGVARLMVGSVADKLLRGASVPLLLHHPHDQH